MSREDRLRRRRASKGIKPESVKHIPTTDLSSYGIILPEGLPYDELTDLTHIAVRDGELKKGFVKLPNGIVTGRRVLQAFLSRFEN